MANRKIPPDAFDFYFSLGTRRSYRAVSEKYGVTKRAVTSLAKRENWQRRMIEVEAQARAKADQRKVETSEAAKERHLQALRLVLGKGIEALRQMQILTPMDAVRAISLAVREMRVELGEPSDRTAVSVEEIIKREYERWVVVEAQESDLPDDRDADRGEAGEIGSAGRGGEK